MNHFARDTVSIPRTVAGRFNPVSLDGRDGKAANLLNGFDCSRHP